MRDRVVPAALLAWATTAASLATYLVCRIRMQQSHNRVVMLKRELEIMRAREAANEKSLTRIVEAMTTLRASTEEQLERLRERADQLRADHQASG